MKFDLSTIYAQPIKQQPSVEYLPYPRSRGPRQGVEE